MQSWGPMGCPLQVATSMLCKAYYCASHSSYSASQVGGVGQTGWSLVMRCILFGLSEASRQAFYWNSLEAPWMQAASDFSVLA